MNHASRDRHATGEPSTVVDPAAHPAILSPELVTSLARQEFLANADRGDDAANDELVAELLRRIRAQRTCHAGGC